MDALAASDPLDRGDVALYDGLAPVYDFVAERLYDYDAIASFVESHAPPETATVVAGACGGGHLLARLARRYERVVGLDRSRAMLDLCRNRTDAHLLAGDLTTFVAPGKFDLFTVLGGTVAHLPADDGTGTDGVVSLFENAYESLAPGGVFLCDFMEAGALESGQVLRASYESDRFRVDRTVITTSDPDESDDLGATARFTYGYEIADTESGETVRAGTTVPAREFRTGAMLGTALQAGFADVTLVTPPTHGAAIVAQRGD